jgi:hypothetical protein
VNFHGIPTPRVVWYKDGCEIFSSRRMRVVVENDVSSLVIHQTAFTDEGEYKCTATNRAGHIITKAKLRLEGKTAVWRVAVELRCRGRWNWACLFNDTFSITRDI